MKTVFAPALAAPAFAGIDEAKALIADHGRLPTCGAPGPVFEAKACMAERQLGPEPVRRSVGRRVGDPAPCTGTQEDGVMSGQHGGAAPVAAGRASPEVFSDPKKDASGARGEWDA